MNTSTEKLCYIIRSIKRSPPNEKRTDTKLKYTQLLF